MTELILVMTTVETQPKAEEIAKELVEKRLAACVQIEGPLQSTYWWQGQLSTATEWKLVAKTRPQLAEKVQAMIAQLHPYQVPEILVTDVDSVARPYLEWVRQSVLSPGDP